MYVAVQSQDASASKYLNLLEKVGHRLSLVMASVRVELTRPEGHQDLSLARLPVPARRHMYGEGEDRTLRSPRPAAARSTQAGKPARLTNLRRPSINRSRACSLFLFVSGACLHRRKAGTGVQVTSGCVYRVSVSHPDPKSGGVCIRVLSWHASAGNLSVLSRSTIVVDGFVHGLEPCLLTSVSGAPTASNPTFQITRL